MTIGTGEESAWRFQKKLTRGSVERRHGSLAEEKNLAVRETEEMMLFKERLGLGMRGRASHDKEGDRLAIAPAKGKNFLCVDLEQALAGNGADGEHPLGMLESEPRSLPSS